MTTPAAARPRLGLLVAAGYPDGVARLLERMSRWCQPVQAEPGRDDVAAWLATSCAAPDVDRAIAGGRPVAVWVTYASELADVPAGVVTVSDNVALDVDVSASSSGIDTAAVPAVAPFVRARWRQRHRLPERLVVRASAMPETVRPTAFALASAVIADDAGALVDAMTWAAPCVTDAATALAVGAAPGADALVGGPTDLADLAAVLADDQRRAAAVGRAGRRLVERRHDRNRPSRELASRLGLVAVGGDDWRAGVASILADLHTPPLARVRDRFEDAVAAIVGARS